MALTGRAGASDQLAVASVVDLAYEAIRERILSGLLPRGSRVHQEDLAVDLGVSRTPVREALRRLAAEGLVEMRTNRGARVADMDRSGMRAAYEARLVIEPGAARIAATRRPDTQLREMAGALARQRRAGRRSVHALFEANRDFHLALVAAAGNPFLDQLAGVLWVARIGEAIYEVQGQTAERRRLDAEEHGAILAAVAGGAPRRAETLARRHLTAAIRRSAL
ncbi:MAG: GntR family transcriptional regulator [Solirubrobacteraceae bacterium]